MPRPTPASPSASARQEGPTREDQDVTELFNSALPAMRRVCYWLSSGPQNTQDSLGLIGLVFMLALSDNDGRLSLHDWACLCLRNAIRDDRKYRRVRQTVPVPHDTPARNDVLRDLWLDVSEDARAVALALIACSEPPARAVQSVAGDLYSDMSWRRFWAAVDELKNYMEES